MRFLSPKSHGYLDYAAVLVLLVAPTLFGFGGAARTLSYALALAHGGLSLLTAYPLGAVKIIPFTVHAGIELAASLFMIGVPLLFGFTGSARGFFLGAGVVLGVVWLVTDYRAAEPAESARTPVRSR